jgi:hypothetical protein
MLAPVPSVQLESQSAIHGNARFNLSAKCSKDQVGRPFIRWLVGDPPRHLVWKRLDRGGEQILAPSVQALTGPPSTSPVEPSALAAFQIYYRLELGQLQNRQVGGLGGPPPVAPAPSNSALLLTRSSLAWPKLAPATNESRAYSIPLRGRP